MKKLLTLVFVLAVSITFSFAQKTVAKQDVKMEKSAVGGPNMAFELTTVDYGTIEHKSDPYRSFSFTNTGDEPLIIKSAKGSCGCTVPEYPNEPIMPSETAEIKVRYATDRIGPFNKSITLTTNEKDPKDPTQDRVHKLFIKGKVNAPAPEPESVPASTGGF